MIKDLVKKIKEKAGTLKNKLRGKIGKRTVATLCALLLVGCAVVLNVFLFNEEGAADDKKQMAVDLSGIDAGELDGDAADVGADAEDMSTDDYFATVSLGRQQARDEAMEVLLSVTENAEALPEAKASAMADINRIALDIEREGQIEAMVASRGFERCVAVVNGDSASVVVCSDTLTPGQTAQISEIVYEAAGIVPANLKIIEKSPV
ncbi:MAG: SpoIIIAH-like family protein [Clostridia bacterium]|nr:SpoIIIAH-like family protein [Clostridia bacterium]